MYNFNEMGKKTKENNNNNNNNNVIGKGKLTPFQVAFIVERYLVDNKFDRTLSAFRSEASSLVSKSSLIEVTKVQLVKFIHGINGDISSNISRNDQAPKSLMGLGELLDEYIWLKEQKVIIEQEKCSLAQERCRIQTLLKGMQGVMNAYYSAAAVNCLTSPLPSVLSSSTPQPTLLSISSPAGYSASGTPVMTSISTTQSVKMDRANFITSLAGGRPPRKRRNNYKDVKDAPQASKRFCSGPLANYPFPRKVSNEVGEPSNACSIIKSPIQSASPNFAQGGLPIQGSSVARNLFNKSSQSSTSKFSNPKTPPRAISSPSEKSISPLEYVSTPTNCTIISSKTIIVSPSKNLSVERNECKFSSPSMTNSKLPSKRDHVKGRLDFDSSDVPSSLENGSGDGSSTSESEKERDTFDLDLPNLDAFGSDFSLAELLNFSSACVNQDCSTLSTTVCTSSDAVLESEPERNNGGSRPSEEAQDLTAHSSAMTEVAAGDKTVNGSETITSVKSVRKCIRIIGPTKSSRNMEKKFNIRKTDVKETN